MKKKMFFTLRTNTMKIQKPTMNQQVLSVSLKPEGDPLWHKPPMCPKNTKNTLMIHTVAQLLSIFGGFIDRTAGEVTENGGN